MSRHLKLFVLGGVVLLLTPLMASAQFRPPFGIPGAPAFPVPFAPPVVPPLPVYSVLPYPITRAFPQYVLYRQYFPPGGTYGGFSQSAPYGSGPVLVPSAYLPGAYGRENFLLTEQHNLEQAQRAATQAGLLAPAEATRSAAPGGAAESGPLPQLNPALTPVDAKAIASGVALNHLLKEIALAESKNAKGPSAYIPPMLFKDIRFAGSPSSDLLTFARQSTLELPAAFDAPALATTRGEFVREFATVAELLRTGKSPDAGRVARLEAAFARLDEGSFAVLKELPAVESTDARRFLTRLGDAIKALKSGAGNGLIDPNWAVEGLTGADLVKHMTKHKLQFGPAPRGATDSYETMHRNLTTYLFVLTQPKK
jgi:hypothetical protein